MLFSLLQLRRFDITSRTTSVSSVTAIAFLLMASVFIIWIQKADVKPPSGKFITIEESRGLFMQLKVQYKSFASWQVVRKLLYSLVIVFLQSSS